jgi:hypothetical protein
MSTCLVFGNFMKKPNGTYGRQHQIELSSLQAIVLLAFNTNDEITYAKLLEITGMAERELNR